MAYVHGVCLIGLRYAHCFNSSTVLCSGLLFSPLNTMHILPNCQKPFPAFLKSWLLAGLIALGGCSTLPEADEVAAITQPVAVEFETARGPVSTGKKSAILQALKNESGNIDILQKHLAVEQAINPDNPLVLGNKLNLLQDGPATYKAMFAAIRAAQDHINLETYIFEDGEIGNKFANLLLEKQAAGVQVNLIYDSVGSLPTPKAFFERLSQAGILVLEFNPVNPLRGKKTDQGVAFLRPAK